MVNTFKVRFLLTIPFLAGAVSCGNNQDNASSPTADTAITEGMPETLNLNPDSSSMMANKQMEMSGTGMQAMGNMSGTDNQIQADDMSVSRLTEQGNFRVSIISELAPIPINQMHSWTLHLVSPAGEFVNNAEITVAGGMPAHNHGMPTSPQVTQSLGEGDYLVEGVQFQMPGHWVINLTISADGMQDSVAYDLMLQP